MISNIKTNNYTLFYIIIYCFLTNSSYCQNKGKSISEFDQMVNSYIKFTVPIITPKDLNPIQSKFTILDAREFEEYKVSHIEGAKHIGYDDFSVENVKNIDHNTPIVVYCSIGYRSEKIGEKLKKLGFMNVQNLYGSLFKWANEGYKMVDMSNKSTTKIHTYNRSWAKWVSNKKLIKVN